MRPIEGRTGTRQGRTESQQQIVAAGRRREGASRKNCPSAWNMIWKRKKRNDGSGMETAGVVVVFLEARQERSETGEAHTEEVEELLQAEMVG